MLAGPLERSDPLPPCRRLSAAPLGPSIFISADRDHAADQAWSRELGPAPCCCAAVTSIDQRARPHDTWRSAWAICAHPGGEIRAWPAGCRGAPADGVLARCQIPPALEPLSPGPGWLRWTARTTAVPSNGTTAGSAGSAGAAVRPPCRHSRAGGVISPASGRGAPPRPDPGRASGRLPEARQMRPSCGNPASPGYNRRGSSILWRVRTWISQ